MPASALAERLSSDTMTWLRAHMPGLMFSAMLALAATFLAEHYGAPAMLFALLLGMAFNFISNEERFATGIGFSARQVLRFGVALLGARITLDHIVALGWGALAGVAAAVALTIGFGVLGAHVLGLRTRFGVLSAGATAICGASAAAAISAVLPRYENQERDTAFTIISVTTFSTIAMILYPVAAGFFDWDDTRIGIFLGGTIHDVAQVVGAGYSVSPEAGDTATIVKLLRVALLVPAVLLIALGSRREAGTAGKRPPLIPGFLVAFLAIVALNSMGLIPELVTGAMTAASSWCIVTAIAALGVKTALGQMLTVGRRAIGLIVAETLFIAAVVIAFLSASPPG